MLSTKLRGSLRLDFNFQMFHVEHSAMMERRVESPLLYKREEWEPLELDFCFKCSTWNILQAVYRKRFPLWPHILEMIASTANTPVSLCKQDT